MRQERGADLLQRLEGGAPPGALVLGERDRLLLARLGVLDLDLDGHDLVVEPAGLLRDFGAAVALRRVAVLLLARDVEVVAHVLGGLAHGLHAVAALLCLEDLVEEGLLETVAADRHALGAHGETDLDGACGDLACDVLDGLKA